MPFERFPVKKPTPESPKEDKNSVRLVEKYNNHEALGFDENKIEQENLENFMDYYAEHKILMNDAGMNALIYRLPFEGNSSLLIKEMRKEKFSGFAQNTSQIELDFQDELYTDLELNVPMPVAIIEITKIGAQNIKEKTELIIMEEIFGLSIGDTKRLLKKTQKLHLPKNFSVENFMKKLRAQIKKMHDSSLYHKDLTLNNVMIQDDGDPVIIDFGTSGYGDRNDPYAAPDHVVTGPDGMRRIAGSRYVSDEQGLITIEQELREMMKGIDI